MTTTDESVTEVTVRDREIASLWLWCMDHQSNEELAEAFARHRLTTLTTQQAEIAALRAEVAFLRKMMRDIDGEVSHAIMGDRAIAHNNIREYARAARRALPPEQLTNNNN